MFAMVVGAVCRIFGGRDSWRKIRITVFWGAFVTALFGVAAVLLTVMYTNLEVYYPIFGVPLIFMPPYWIGFVFFIWYISISISVAQGFKHVSAVFLSMSIVALAGLIGAMYFHAIGML